MRSGIPDPHTVDQFLGYDPPFTRYIKPKRAVMEYAQLRDREQS